MTIDKSSPRQVEVGEGEVPADAVPAAPRDRAPATTDRSSSPGADASRSEGAREAPPTEALGLFKDTPDVIDRALEHVAEMRSRSRLRPLE